MTLALVGMALEGSLCNLRSTSVVLGLVVVLHLNVLYRHWVKI